MKKLVYLLVFSFAAVSMISCGASSNSCVSAEKFQVKNIKFENEVIVVSKDFVQEFTTTKHMVTNSKFETEVIFVSNDLLVEPDSNNTEVAIKNPTNTNVVVSNNTEVVEYGHSLN